MQKENLKTWIAPGAQIYGDVQLGENVSVWYNAVIRGDEDAIVIGENSNIQDNCTLHADEGFPVQIGKGVTVGHNAVVHGCRIGDNSLIGIGSIVFNGAVVGRNCIVGMGAVVTFGTVIPDGSLVVGTPAKVMRKLTAEEIEDNKKSALSYVHKYKKHLHDGENL